MLFQVAASILMIFTLQMYHGYDRGDPSLIAIQQALANKNLAIGLFYTSRCLSGWSAGRYFASFEEFPASKENTK
jgi:hypothetical protein